MLYTALAFIVIAFLYAAVGFGGGSSYSAILIESDLSWELVPLLSLLCNIVVVSGGVYHYSKAGSLNLKFALPLISASVPAAFLAGSVRLNEPVFMSILAAALLVSGVLMLLDRRWQAASASGERQARAGVRSLLVLGLLLGGLAGITGIGGGIYLAPVLHFFRLAKARTVAATASLFILVNSIAGFGGQLSKLGGQAEILLGSSYLFLPLAVLLGGQLGSRVGAVVLPAAPIRRLTGLLVVIVAARIFWQL